MKKSTGKKISVEDFHKEEKCLRCGIMCGELKQICDNCTDYRKCNVCEALMRNIPYVTYEYIYKVVKGTKFYEEIVKTNNPISKESTIEGTCEDCVDYTSRIKSRCYVCSARFKNTPENYKMYGNTCSECVDLIEVKFDEQMRAHHQTFQAFMNQSMNWDEFALTIYPRG